MTHRPLFQNLSSYICSVCAAVIHWLDDDDGDGGGSNGGSDGGGGGGESGDDVNEMVVAAVMMMKGNKNTNAQNAYYKVLFSQQHNREAQRCSITCLAMSSRTGFHFYWIPICAV